MSTVFDILSFRNIQTIQKCMKYLYYKGFKQSFMRQQTALNFRPNVDQNTDLKAAFLDSWPLEGRKKSKTSLQTHSFDIIKPQNS